MFEINNYYGVYEDKNKKIFQHVKDGIRIDLRCITNKNGFKKIYQIIEKR